jgi:hypothetical protein
MRSISLVLVLFACHTAQAQKGRFHHRISNVLLKSLEKKGVVLTPQKDSICTQQDAVLKGVVTRDGYVLSIDFWTILHKPPGILDPCAGQAEVINSQSTMNYALQLPIRNTVGDPTVKASIPYRSWIYGINSLGIKWRGSVTDSLGTRYDPSVVSGNINLGITVGRSFGWTKFTHRSTNNLSFTPAFALGFSSANLSKELLRSNVDVSKSTSNLILSPAASFIVARNEFGLIFSYGWDLMTGPGSDAWAYQGKPFFGLGISASLKL